MSKNTRRVALITGASNGVGKACAKRFAKLGFDIVVNYHTALDDAKDTVALVEAAGGQALLAQCDVGQDAKVKQMIQAVEERFGRIDVIVNSAGMTYFVDHLDLDGMTEEKWDRILAVNTKGPFFVIRAAYPLMKASDIASVVNISSASAFTGTGSSIAYAASKGALNTMTKTLAKAFAPGIRVNAVCPGPINSRWLHQGLTEEQIEKAVSQLLIPELIQPEDVAGTVTYLALESTKSTGQTLVLDGGRTMR